MKKLLIILGIMATIALMMLESKAFSTQDYVRSILKERETAQYVYFTTETTELLYFTENLSSISVSGTNLIISSGTFYNLVDVSKVSNSIATQATTETILIDLTLVKQIYSNIELTVYGINLSPMDGLERNINDYQKIAILITVFIAYIIVRAFKVSFD